MLLLCPPRLSRRPELGRADPRRAARQGRPEAQPVLADGRPSALDGSSRRNDRRHHRRHPRPQGCRSAAQARRHLRFLRVPRRPRRRASAPGHGVGVARRARALEHARPLQPGGRRRARHPCRGVRQRARAHGSALASVLCAAARERGHAQVSGHLRAYAHAPAGRPLVRRGRAASPAARHRDRGRERPRRHDKDARIGVGGKKTYASRAGSSTQQSPLFHTTCL